jgi:ribosome recycling factor
MAKRSSYAKEAEEKMKKTIEHFEDELKKVRTGRPTTAIFEDIKVDYYGVPTPINQVATLSVGEERTVAITPWDKKMLEPIEKAINASNFGFHAINDGNVVRVSFPNPTIEERRKLVKAVKEMLEETKVALRNIRRDDIKKVKEIKNDGSLSEDEAKKMEEEIQEILKEKEEEAEKIFQRKEKEIMES